MKTARICLWSSPRNVSTAFMYSFANREDTVVYDESLYPHFLDKTGAERPDREVTMAEMDTDGERVVREVILGPHPKPVAFFKLMPHFLVDMNLGFLSQTRNFFLIRDPAEILNSYTRVIKQPTMLDIGQKEAYDLYRHLENQGQAPPVINSRDLLMDPEGMLTRLCAALEIPFSAKMLQWPAGPRPEDGPWAQYWYHSVHQSTGFKPYQKQEITLPDHLLALEAESRPYFEYLSEKSMKSE